MAKYKVCVYAICKNEEQFVERWVNSMSEADEIYVLDTGSTDNTVEKLKELGVNVTTEIISPWRFDVARNKSLDLVPKDADICVCTDLDEVFHKGWREKLESVWTDNVTRIKYRYTWSFNPDGSEGVVFISDKIHSRRGYKWVGAVHEVLSYNNVVGTQKFVLAEGVQLDHFPDCTKPRSQYLPLLELAVSEDPENDRNMHYLGREYMYYGMWQKSIDTLKKHLSLKSATWKDERCASMRFIAKGYEGLNDMNEAEKWYLYSIAEAPYLREPWLDFAVFANNRGEWDLCVWLCESALKIKERSLTYINEAKSYGSLPHDLLSLGYFYTGRYDKALYHIKTAVEFEPQNRRLQNNLILIKDKIND